MDIIAAVGETVCSSVGVAGTPQPEMVSTNSAIANRWFFIFIVSS
jgi:hypothetical protein